MTRPGTLAFVLLAGCAAAPDTVIRTCAQAMDGGSGRACVPFEECISAGPCAIELLCSRDGIVIAVDHGFIACEDAGMPDAGPALDAGAPDAGPALDAGPEPDAGP